MIIELISRAPTKLLAQDPSSGGALGSGWQYGDLSESIPSASPRFIDKKKIPEEGPEYLSHFDVVCAAFRGYEMAGLS